MPTYVVTFFKDQEPVGEDYVVEADGKYEAVAKVENDHEGIIDQSDDFIVVEVPPEPPESSER